MPAVMGHPEGRVMRGTQGKNVKEKVMNPEKKYRKKALRVERGEFLLTR